MATISNYKTKQGEALSRSVPNAGPEADGQARLPHQAGR